MTHEAAQELHDALKKVLSERGLDARTCYTAIRVEAPAGARLVFECSDRSVAEAVTQRVSPNHAASVAVEILPNEPSLPELLMANHSVADVRRSPDHAAELVSQVIDGDTLEPLKMQGDWYLVRMNDGYIGWVRSWHLAPTTSADSRRFDREAKHRVTANVTQLLEAPDEDALPVTDAVVGTQLIAAPGGRRGWRRVTLADGRSGFAPAKHIGRRPRRRRVVRETLVTTGMRFLGIPYLWGGTTPKGFDCSGLVQRIFALQGLLLPRDSDQQAQHGRLKRIETLDDLNTGDLLFFGRDERKISHVALYISDGLFLHAYGHVRVGALDPRHNLFDARLREDWRLTRDPLDG